MARGGGSGRDSGRRANDTGGCENMEARTQKLETRHLSVAYESRLVVADLNIEMPIGKITALVGPNGSGKSTILKAMARLLPPRSGGVLLDGKDIHLQPTKEIAKKLAILPQNPSAPEGLTVFELIGYGRFPHQSGFRNLNGTDREIIAWAMALTNTAELQDRPVDELSGGQRQRVWIAMALAQQTEILFLDEPTTFLDMAHQLDVLDLLKNLNEREARTIVMVVHDLNHAARYAHHIIAIKDGKTVCEGAPETLMNKPMLKTVFGIEADIVSDPRTGIPLCLPYK
jgi:iron complex transport system ATP-binding protein